MFTDRKQPVCPITGQPARYKDPRTGVPYANVAAYRTLSRMLIHDFVWSDQLGCYVGDHADVETAVETWQKDETAMVTSQ